MHGNWGLGIEDVEGAALDGQDLVVSRAAAGVYVCVPVSTHVCVCVQVCVRVFTKPYMPCA